MSRRHLINSSDVFVIKGFTVGNLNKCSSTCLISMAISRSNKLWNKLIQILFSFQLKINILEMSFLRENPGTNQNLIAHVLLCRAYLTLKNDDYFSARSLWNWRWSEQEW